MATSGVDIYVLRDTWDLHGAYKLAMKHYYNAMHEEMSVQGAKTRWHDFRVLPDFQSDELNGVYYDPNNATPVMDASEFNTGDHTFSTIVDAGGTTRSFSLDTTTTGTEWSIIDEWVNNGRVQNTPATASATLPYANLVEDQDEANYDILRLNGDQPPYTNAPDDQLYTKVGTIRQVSPDGVMKLSSGYFEAPLGLVILVSSAFTSPSKQEHPLMVTYAPGNYKGVKATPYATPKLVNGKEYEVE